MPPPLARFHSRNPPFPDLGRKHRTEPVTPVSHSLVNDIDAAFVQEIFHISKGQRERDVQHHRQADDLRTGFEITKWRELRASEDVDSTPALPASTHFALTVPLCSLQTASERIRSAALALLADGVSRP